MLVAAKGVLIDNSRRRSPRNLATVIFCLSLLAYILERLGSAVLFTYSIFGTGFFVRVTAGPRQTPLVPYACPDGLPHRKPLFAMRLSLRGASPFLGIHRAKPAYWLSLRPFLPSSMISIASPSSLLFIQSRILSVVVSPSVFLTQGLTVPRLLPNSLHCAASTSTVLGLQITGRARPGPGLTALVIYLFLLRQGFMMIEARVSLSGQEMSPGGAEVAMSEDGVWRSKHYCYKS